MGYYYAMGDGSAHVTAGVGGVGAANVIQRSDGLGGYNVSFSVPGALDIYHVHFGAGGCRVKVVRHKPDAASQGSNIIRHNNGPTKRLGDLAHECAGYANHYALLTHLAAAVAAAPRLPNGEIA
ncbi:hypothetical protein [Polymorphobacter fuscus]|uniref:Uncharacterized protein n=1 Tax=Sandarakinorhabdus fusca TaxID=1439888 RepID=A0A7C9GN38_9SPHN|nr:hypothetical protein [Polymorphobacter fuscus]KAB7648890.1 hypothetical protein F9290_04295 [Polymorphobacter fuscus]MQT16477.1 hypothetical protein [Polymorphobacter fuscus]NJC07233.1 hypothetical protein [Polymorphobacter fuscus]